MMGVYRTLGVVCAAAATLAGVSYTERAEAANRKEYVVILLDRSGSMLQDAFFDPATNTRRSLWTESLQQARSRVTGQQDDQDSRPSSDTHWEDPVYDPPQAISFYPASSHCYQIWSFGDTSVTTHFPTDGTWFCTTQADGFTKDRNKYATVLNQINSVPPPANAGVTTPLAHGLCKALRTVRDAAIADPLWDPGDPNQVQLRRSVIMQSDGLENSTLLDDPCKGDNSEPQFNPALANSEHPEFLAWAGGLSAGSWELKVYNMAFHDDPASPAFPFMNGDREVWGLRSGKSFLDFFMEAYGLPDFVAIDQAEMVTLNIDALFRYVPKGGTGAAVTDPNPKLQALFRNFSKHSGGRYQRILYDGNRPPLGQPHDPPQDVSDDGCVNAADYNMVTQRDVYGKRTSEQQIVRRCDVNKDGWVNHLDRDLVSRNWGKKRANYGGTCR